MQSFCQKYIFAGNYDPDNLFGRNCTMIKSRLLPDTKTCRTRKLSTGLCECMVKHPVSCEFVRVDNKAYYCHFPVPVKKLRKSTLCREI